jgi:hypothetical protein
VNATRFGNIVVVNECTLHRNIPSNALSSRLFFLFVLSHTLSLTDLSPSTIFSSQTSSASFTTVHRVNMADDVRRRQSIMSVAMQSVSIRDYNFNEQDYEVPSWLKVPTEMHDTMRAIRNLVFFAVKSIHQIMTFHDKRYYALCSGDLGLIYDMHTYSIKRLLEWREQSDPDDPTLAPAPKIPRDALKFTLDPQHYQRFSEWYHDMVKNFMKGPYGTYRQAKHDLSITAAQVLDEHAYREWRHWWDGSFVPAMWKWETCLEGMILPTWEEVIDDVFLMILDRVENPGELANSLCSSCSPPVTPQEPTTITEVFPVS